MLDLRIVGGTVVSDGVAAPLDVAVEGGTIVAVAPPGTLGAAEVEVDASDLHVLPGVIDVHFHCRAPANPWRADFATETRAAAAGGVTTVCEMPISDPACSTPQAFATRRSLVAEQAHVNVALYAGAAVTRSRAQEMAALGAIAFKLFMTSPPTGREREFDGLWATAEADILDALVAVASTGLPCVVHAENDALLRSFAAASDTPVPPRPPLAEALAIASVAILAREAGARLHVAHVTSRSALAALRGAVAAGADVSGETCPQYLVLDEGAIERHGGIAKIGPPLRQRADCDALWHALAVGELALLASDHSPFLVDEKTVPYLTAPMGLPTVEVLLSVLLDGVARGRLALEPAIALVTAAPARLAGLYPRKGRIAPGADADVAIVSLDETWRPGPATLISRAAGCGIVYDEMQLKGRVRTTIVNGRVAFEHSAPTPDRHGRFVPGAQAEGLAPS